METTTLASALSSLDLTVIMDSILEVLPIALPVVISMLGFRKGLSFFKKLIKGA